MYAILRELRRFLPEFRQKRLLDIGCGPMHKTAVFQALGFQCCAVDDLNDSWHLRDGNIQQIKDYAKRIGIKFYHQKPGDYTIPFGVGSFDVVCSLAVIEHLHESPREMLNCMGTLARPNGLLVITMPNSVNLRKRLSVLFGRTNYPPVDMFYNYIGVWRGHVREYTLREAVYICEASGFEVLSNTTFEYVAHMKLAFPLKQLYLFLGSLVPTGRSGLLVICRKPESWKPAKEDPEACRRALARGIPEGVA
jgi:SAM-dependent methyltransferase